MANPTQNRLSLISHLNFHLQTKIEFASLPSHHFHVVIYAVLGAGARAYACFLEKIRFKGATATIEAGQKLPYLAVDLFQTNNGIRIKAGDFSHPTCIEVDFCIPDWADRIERKTDELVGALGKIFNLEEKASVAEGQRSIRDYAV